MEEFKEAAKTIENWLPYIVNSFIDERFSNGFTEGLNNKIKVIKRIGFGYRNFDFFRLRIMYILNGKMLLYHLYKLLLHWKELSFEQDPNL